MIPDSYFDLNHQVLLAVAILLLVVSTFTHELTRKQNLGLLLLLCGTFILKLFVISVDPFLNLWDEQFHALVAKNLASDPFTPKLWPDTVMEHDYRAWVRNHIWVHKQPWFLWQMAMSIKILGPTAFAVRLPDAICFTFAVFCLYRIGKIFFTPRIGFVAAILFATNFFFAEMMVSNEPTDHNDIIFICYILASIWAFAEYRQQPKLKWQLLIVLFCSFAVLTKWLPGYLVFGIWFVYLIQQPRPFVSQRKEWIQMISTFLLSLILPMSWQVYIHTRFPQEAAYEKEHNWRHITEALDGHVGDNLFYLDNITRTFAPYAPFFILFGVFLLIRFAKEKKIYWSMFIISVIVYIFFTFVQTKMHGFTAIVYFIFYLGFGAVAELLYQRISFKPLVGKLVLAVLISMTAVIYFNIEAFQKQHTLWKKAEFGILNYRNHNLDWRLTCAKLKKDLGDDKYVIFNVDWVDPVKTMFYTEHLAYSEMPGEADLKRAKEKGYKVAFLDNGKLPTYILQDTSFYIFRGLQDVVLFSDTVEMRLNDTGYVCISPEGFLYTGRDYGSPIVVTLNGNGYVRLSNLSGKILSSRMIDNGRLVFEKDLCEVYERFVLVKEQNGKFTIRTPFKEDIVIPQYEKYFYTKSNTGQSFTVDFIKRKNGIPAVIK